MAIKITKQPTSKAGFVGDKVYYSVEAAGNALVYKWQYTSNGGSSWANSPLAGADTASLQVPVTESRNKMGYRCKITDADGEVVYTIAATLTVLDVTSANGLVPSEVLTAIANAIRAKTETTNKILPADMAAIIEGIEVGGVSSGGALSGTFTAKKVGTSASLGVSLPVYENYCLLMHGGTRFAAHKLYGGVYTDNTLAANSKYNSNNHNGHHWKIEHDGGDIGFYRFDGATSDVNFFETNVTYDWYYFPLEVQDA